MPSRGRWGALCRQGCQERFPLLQVCHTPLIGDGSLLCPATEFSRALSGLAKCR